MAILFNIVNFLSFLSGIAFGLFICFIAVVHYLSDHTHKPITSDVLNTPDSKKVISADLAENEKDLSTGKVQSSITQIQGSYVPQRLSKAEQGRLSEIIEFLDELNSPLKNMGAVLERIHLNKEHENAQLDFKMKTIIEYSTINKLEKEFQDSVSQLKDHGKQIKLISNFLYDLGKVFSTFSRDISKLSHTARNNVNKSSQSLDRKEDMIANNWWQTLQIALDSMANDQEDLATIISDELINYSNQIQEEISIIEKRLATEGSKQFGNLRDQLNIFETRLKERDKAKEKLRTTPIQASPSSNATGTSESYQRRAQRLKASDDVLVGQTKKLYEIQKEFYLLLPRIHSDVQLTIIKSIVETQSQLLKLTDGIDRIQSSNKSICARMKTQLTNAASSLVQMIREDSNLLPEPTAAGPISDSPSGTTASAGFNSPESIALLIMKQRMKESGVKGFELTLHKVLEGLMIQSQLKDASATTKQAMGNSGTNMNSAAGMGVSSIPVAAYTAANSTNPAVKEDISGLRILEDLGKLDMYQEATACLAASNPYILPELPKSFSSAIGTETCVWFNAFSGRVYRDIANSQYFHKWFCTKLAQMLNKKGKNDRPAYIDKFEVNAVKFGELPPLLLNVKWSPQLKKAGLSAVETIPKKSTEHKKSEFQSSSSTKVDGKDSKPRSTENEEKEDDTASEASADEEEDDFDEQHQGDVAHDDKAGNADFRIPRSSNTPEDNQFYAACTADMAFRSGLNFTVSTKLWINWPRDRYASVPVMFYLDLAELSGRIRFGVERSHSFLTFLKDPITRISVRSEVGGDKYKLKDIPQISDFIVKKLKKFIHRKIVYPHAHKFRLIWPRNWWPEGTENLFLPQEQLLNAGSRPSSPIPEHRSAEVRTPLTSPTAVAAESTSSDIAADSVPASKQLLDATSKLMNKARTFNFSSNSAATSSKPVTTPASKQSIQEQDFKTPTPTAVEEPSNDISVNSNQQKEVRWMQHLKNVSDHSSEIVSPSIGAISSQEKRRLELQFFRKQKPTKITASFAQKLASGGTGTLPPLPRGRGVSTSNSASATLSEKTSEELQFGFTRRESLQERRLTRSYSIFDFRVSTADVVLDGILERLQPKIADALDITRRSSFTGLTNDDAVQSLRRQSLPNSKKRANSSYYSKGDDGTITSNRNQSGWLSSKGREAKAKFLEFKNKHFGSQNKSAAPLPLAQGGGEGGGVVDERQATLDAAKSTAELDLEKAYKSAARFGGKLKDFFKINEEGEGSAAGGSVHRRMSAKPGQSLMKSNDENDDSAAVAHVLPDGGRQRRGSDVDGAPRSADVGIDEQHPSNVATKSSTMKFVTSMMFRGSNSHNTEHGGGGGADNATRSGRVASSDGGGSRESRANAILTKALNSVRQTGDKEGDS